MIIMAEHISSQLMDAYQKRTLAARELISVDRHLAVCADCRAQLTRLRDWSATASALQQEFIGGVTASDHPEHDQMNAYVDGTLDEVDEEIVEGHLEVCASCAGVARDLRAFKQQLAATPAQPATVTTLPPARSRKPLLMVALAAAAMLLLALAVTLPLQQRARDLQDRVALLERDRESLKEQVTQLQDRLNNIDNRIDQPDNSSMITAINDARGRITIDSSGTIAGLSGLSAQETEMVRLALQKGGLPLPAERELVRGSSDQTGDGVPFALIEPLAKTIESDRPKFRWQPVAGALSYQVTIYASNYQEVIKSEPLTVAEWSVPQALERGRIYIWEVAARTDGRELVSHQAPAPPARFKVLDRARAQELASVRRRFPDSHLMRGLSYARAGLLAEAEVELRALAAANKDSAIARKLLQAVKDF